METDAENSCWLPWLGKHSVSPATGALLGDREPKAGPAHCGLWGNKKPFFRECASFLTLGLGGGGIRDPFSLGF